ncbi:MAG: F0F1 ATP synthase subunit B [Planctomycetaceae bacterium]
MLAVAAPLIGEGNLLDFPNVPTILWTWVTFFITLWALSKVAWPMLAKKMEEREVRILAGLKKAEEAEQAAAGLLKRQEEVLRQAKEEAQAILAESRSSAAHMQAEAVAAAQREIGAERDRARREIQLERSKALDELRREAVDLTLLAAGRVLERELKGEDQRRLAAEVIGQVESLR